MSNFQVINDVEARQEISDFIDLLQKNRIYPQKVILFGSFAKGNQHRDSDIDLAVVSDKFRGDEFDEITRLLKLSSQVSDRIEAIPFNEREFNLSKYHALIGEVKKYGKVVYEN